MYDQPHLRATKNNALAARRVLRACSTAALATRMADDPGGAPYVSLVTLATDPRGAPILLLSGLADHSRNIAADARVSLLAAATEGYPNPQEAPRVTLIGRAIREDDAPRVAALKDRFLARHPGAALYAGFADFAFFSIAVERAHFVGGFGRAIWLDGAQVCAAPDLSAVAQEIMARTTAPDGRLVALDGDGCDLAAEEGAVATRLCFSEPATDRAGLDAALREVL